MTNAKIYISQVPERGRVSHTTKVFGIRFLWIESFVLDIAVSLCADCDGSEWEFYELSNSGFYMAPAGPDHLSIIAASGYTVELSPQEFGIACCLCVYSMLASSPNAEFSDLCARHHDLLLRAALQHPGATAILQAID